MRHEVPCPVAGTEGAVSPEGARQGLLTGGIDRVGRRNRAAVDPVLSDTADAAWRVVVDADAGEAGSGRRCVEQERAGLGDRAAAALALQRVAVADPEPGVGLLHRQPRAVRLGAAATGRL